MSDNGIRIAIIDKDKCKPNKCNHECKAKCPVNQMGVMCIEIEETAKIHQSLCISCGLCSKVCPFGAIKMVNIPSQIINDLVHSYGENLFKLYRLPGPKMGKIIGIMGPNGCGKSTVMNILSGNILPNFDKYDDKPDITKDQVLKNVRGSELQKYLKLLYDEKLRINNKPQDILYRLNKLKDKELKISDIINKYKNSKDFDKIINILELDKIMSNTIKTISGGELQKLVCATTLLKEADVYIFDEPTNYLDIEYRIKIANLIKDMSNKNNYIFIVDHDLSVLDFVADFIHIMYGDPGFYGVVSTLYNKLDAINMYFDGYIPADNMRFRSEPFKLIETNLDDQNDISKNVTGIINYDETTIKFNNYQLLIKHSQIDVITNMIVILGKNGTGKSTYLNYLNKEIGLNISFKQQINNSYTNNKLSVQELLYNQIKDAMLSHMFVADVINLLGLNKIYQKKIKKISGGELQRLSIALCLGKPANIYLIDEPSANLDIEYRFITTKVIKRFLINNRKIGFIAEHDILMAITLAKEKSSKIIVFEEIKNENNIRYCETSPLLDFNVGINKFLKIINTTFRTDKINNRPKINKLESVNDREQKLDGIYYK